MDNAIERNERVHLVAEVAGTFSKQDDGSKTTNQLDVEQMDDDFVTLCIVTWNLGEAEPSDKDASFFRRFRESDLVMIGAQECEEI